MQRSDCIFKVLNVTAVCSAQKALDQIFDCLNILVFLFYHFSIFSPPPQLLSDAVLLYIYIPYLINIPFQTILVSPNDEEYDMLLRQLQQRIQDGNGETLYEIGVGGR